MPIFVGHHHLLQDLLDVLVGGFHCVIHLRPIQRGIMMFNLELYTEFCDHSVVEIGTIICNDSFSNTITADEVVFNEYGYHVLCD